MVKRVAPSEPPSRIRVIGNNASRALITSPKVRTLPPPVSPPQPRRSTRQIRTTPPPLARGVTPVIACSGDGLLGRVQRRNVPAYLGHETEPEQKQNQKHGSANGHQKTKSVLVGNLPQRHTDAHVSILADRADML